MGYRKRFVVEPGTKVRLGKIAPAFKDKHQSHDTAKAAIEKHVERMAKLQYLLYADGNQSLLVVLQALDAGGKDGVVRHVFSAMNPQGTWVFGFKQRLDDTPRHWKISDTDYSERELWPDYIEAFEDAMERTSTKHAPWYVIPSNHKWFRNLAISEIVADTLGDIDLKLPPTQVDIAEIRRKYHAAAQEERRGDKPPKGSHR